MLAGSLGSLAEFKPLTAIPGIGTALGNIFGVSEAAAPTSASFANLLATQTAKESAKSWGKSAVQNAVQNAIAGGTFGFAGGQGGLEERGQSALDAAKFAGILGGGVSGGAGVVGGLARQLAPVGEDLASGIRGVLKKQPPNISGAEAALSPDIIQSALARHLVEGGFTPSELDAIGPVFENRLAAGQPIFLAEAAESATGKPGLYGRANLIVSTPEARAIADNALAERESGLLDRSRKILDIVGQEESPWEIGSNLQGGAEKILTLAKKETGIAARAAYTDLEKKVGIVEDPIVKSILDEDSVQGAIKTAKKANRELRDLPDDHFRVLHEAYKILRDSSYKKTIATNSAYAPTVGALEQKQIVEPLRDALDAHAPEFPQIREKYGEYLDKIQNIKESGIAILTDLKAGDLDKAVGKILTQSPKQIETFLDALSHYAPELILELKNGVRLKLSKQAYNEKGFAKVFKNWEGDNPKTQEVLNLVLGEDTTKNLNLAAAEEQQRQLATAKYGLGSPTWGRGQEEAQSQNFISKLIKAIKKPVRSAERSVDAAFTDPNAMLNKALAQIMFNSQRGLEGFYQALPLARRQAGRQQMVLNAPDIGQALARMFATPSGGLAGNIRINKEK